MRRGTKAMEDNKETCEVHVSSGNVFADLGLPDSDEMLLKSDILVSILGAIEDRQLTQRDVAKLLGVDQSEVSKLKNCKIRGFSAARLLRFLAALGNEVEISVRPVDHAGKVCVVAR